MVTNYDESEDSSCSRPNNPRGRSYGPEQRVAGHLSKVIYIERDDFAGGATQESSLPPSSPAAGAPALPRAPPREEVERRRSWVTELRCTYDPMSGGGSSSGRPPPREGRHRVSAKDAGGRSPLFNPFLYLGRTRRRGGGQTWEDNQPRSRWSGSAGYLEPAARDSRRDRPCSSSKAWGYFSPRTLTSPC